jgi:hypothetical protein
MQIPWYILLYMYCSQTVQTFQFISSFNCFSAEERSLLWRWDVSEFVRREKLRNVGSQKPRATCAVHTVFCICKNLTVCAIFVICNASSCVKNSFEMTYRKYLEAYYHSCPHVLKIICSLKLLKCIMMVCITYCMQTENKAYSFFFKKFWFTNMYESIQEKGERCILEMHSKGEIHVKMIYGDMYIKP